MVTVTLCAIKSICLHMLSPHITLERHPTCPNEYLDTITRKEIVVWRDLHLMETVDLCNAISISLRFMFGFLWQREVFAFERFKTGSDTHTGRASTPI